MVNQVLGVLETETERGKRTREKYIKGQRVGEGGEWDDRRRIQEFFKGEGGKGMSVGMFKLTSQNENSQAGVPNPPDPPLG